MPLPAPNYSPKFYVQCPVSAKTQRWDQTAPHRGLRSNVSRRQAKCPKCCPRQAGLLLLFSHAANGGVRSKATHIFVNRGENDMKQRQWQLAHRETAAKMPQPKRVLVLVSVATILEVSGPFRTHDQMQILPRLLY